MEGGRRERKGVGVWEWKRGREGQRGRGDYGRWGKRHKRVPVKGGKEGGGGEKKQEERGSILHRKHSRLATRERVR